MCYTQEERHLAETLYLTQIDKIIWYKKKKIDKMCMTQMVYLVHITKRHMTRIDNEIEQEFGCLAEIGYLAERRYLAKRTYLEKCLSMKSVNKHRRNITEKLKMISD